MYLLTFSISTFMIYQSERYRKKNKTAHRIFLLIALLVPSVLAGVRDYTIGNDVLLYGNHWFESAVNSSSLTEYVNKAIEYSIGSGYAVVNFIASRISTNPHVFYLIYELILMTILYKAVAPFRNEISIPFAFMIYFFSYYNSSFNILRQIMAVMIVLLSFKYVVNKKLFRFLIIIFIASTFHNSAIISVVLYPLNWAMHSRLRNMFKVGIFVGCIGAAVLYEQLYYIFVNLNLIPGARYAYYITSSDVGGRFVRLFEWLIIVMLVLWKREKCIKYSDKSNTLITYTTISFLLSLLAFTGSTWSVRIVYYFDIFAIFTLGILAKNLGVRDKSLNKATSYTILAAFLFLKWLFVYVIRNGAATFPFLFM